MDVLTTYDPFREAIQLREQLSSHTRRLGFFFGAGTSMAVGLDGIILLSKKVAEMIRGELRPHYKSILEELGEAGNVEGILNRVRVYRELLGDDSSRSFNGISGSMAKLLEREICLAIYRLVNTAPPKGIGPHQILAQWIQSVERDHPVEIFTTNYDLLFERGMESEPAVPFFDGFIGAVEPFFAPESVEADGSDSTRSVYPPNSWVRLWKIHGSIGWRVRENRDTGKRTIIRQPNIEPDHGSELLIYPSREKYVESRKLPYIAYIDRLRRFLNSGEAILVIVGYSFGSEGLPALIDLDKLISRHCAIVGSTGSGKSNTVAQILKSLTTGRYPSARVILIDPHGEYYSALKDVSRVFRIEDPENPLYIPFWTLTFDELAWFLVDRKSGTETVQDGNLRRKVFEQKQAMVGQVKAGRIEGSSITVDSPVPFCIRETWYHFDRAERVTYEDQARTKEALIEEGDARSLKSAQFKPPGAGSSSPFKPSGKTGLMLQYVNKIYARLKDRRFDFILSPGEYDGLAKDLHDLLASWVDHA